MAPGSTRAARRPPGSLRVAIVFGTYPPERNGGADFVARFGAGLAAQGAEVHVLTSTAEDDPAESFPSAASVHRVIDDWTLSPGGRAALRRVDRLLRSEGVEIVHVLFPDSVLQARYQLPAAIGAGAIPLVTTFWNLGLGRRSPVAVKAEALALLARSAALTSHDPSYLGVLRRLAGWAKPVHWLPVGSSLDAPQLLDRQAVRRRLALPGGRLVGFFGHLDFTRGAEELFEAVAILRQTQDVRLLMIGSAGEARYGAYRQAADRYGIAGAVDWTGYLPARETAEALRTVEVCVLPYRRNSLGRSALAAALELGVPTVLGGTRAGITPLRDGVHVALAPPQDAARLAATIARVLENEHERTRLGEGARRAAGLFAWPRIAAGALGLYRSVLANRL